MEFAFVTHEDKVVRFTTAQPTMFQRDKRRQIGSKEAAGRDTNAKPRAINAPPDFLLLLNRLPHYLDLFSFRRRQRDRISGPFRILHVRVSHPQSTENQPQSSETQPTRGLVCAAHRVTKVYLSAPVAPRTAVHPAASGAIPVQSYAVEGLSNRPIKQTTDCGRERVYLLSSGSVPPPLPPPPTAATCPFGNIPSSKNGQKIAERLSIRNAQQTWEVDEKRKWVSP